MESNTPWPLRRSARSVLLVGVCASLVLLWNLGGRYLWQDEAACAVLAQRMLRFGRPLGWDGQNLITMDEYRPGLAEVIPERTATAESAIEYFVANGDFKADTTWIGQPWGQFVLTALSFSALGEGTVQARLPFVLCGVLTACTLFAFLRRKFRSPLVAWVATALLLGNTFWFLHVRQCRYYAPASLLLLLTFASYLDLHEGRRFGALKFVLSAWAWFQVDFGSPWPVLGVLFVHGLVTGGTRVRRIATTYLILGGLLLPFVLFYEIFGRVRESFDPWTLKLSMLAFYVNRFQLPLLLLVPLIVWLLRRKDDSAELQVAGLAVAIVLAKLLWMATVGPFAYYRYVVDGTPLACLVVAYVLVRGTDGIAHRVGRLGALGLLWGTVCVQLATPWLSIPAALVLPRRTVLESFPDFTWIRQELRAYVHQWRTLVGDPNRAVAEYLAPRLKAKDEILVNYEDIPLMFYTSNPVRGGIGAFRVLDPGAPPPRFAILRDRVPFVYAKTFRREFSRYLWQRTALDALDVPWGNNPDPFGYDYVFLDQDIEPIYVYENVGSR